MHLVNKKLQVRHYPQIPCKPFVVDVKDEIEAKKIADTLAFQHLWLYQNNFIPDYSNSIEVVMWDENSDGQGNADWTTYFNEVECMDWDEFEEKYLSEKK